MVNKKIATEERQERMLIKLDAIIEEARRAGAQFKEEEMRDSGMLIASSAPEEMDLLSFSNMTYFRLDSPVWGGDSSVTVRFTRDDNSVLGIRAAVEVSWSSTRRSVANALATVTQYQKTVQFAAFVEAMFQ